MLSHDEVAAKVEAMRPEWDGASYSLRRKNCCDFVEALAYRLDPGMRIPSPPPFDQQRIARVKGCDGRSRMRGSQETQWWDIV